MKFNQKGLTLVELIAALALVSLIAAAAWTALTIGMQHGAAETKKTQLQQDSNIIISTLINVHRNSEKYSLTFEANKLKIESCNDAGICENNTLDMAYDFTGTIIGSHTVDDTDAVPDSIANLTPKTAHTEITLVITDLKNPKQSLSVKTTLTRMLTNLN
ncbi:type II secretion system protein [Planomicrobium okeanokoites]|uniref:PulJ/GspJ family protein n=1 Tax=Planomicrobium okeanokoites TaxID=244 RepID=UPI0030F64DCA